jgi:hypothetical protein
VYLYNGPSTTSPRIADLTGTVIQAPYTWTSTGNTMTIQFITDFSVTFRGLVGSIAFVDPPSSSPTGSTTATSRPSISSRATVAPTATPQQAGQPDHLQNQAIVPLQVNPVVFPQQKHNLRVPLPLSLRLHSTLPHPRIVAMHLILPLYHLV